MKKACFELIGTAGRTFSHMHAAGAFAKAAGTEMCKGNGEEMSSWIVQARTSARDEK